MTNKKQNAKSRINNIIFIHIMSVLDLAKANRMLPIGNRRAWSGKHGTVCSGVLPGDYLLKDNSFSASTVFGQEKGIFLSNYCCISLAHLPPVAVTAGEALGYCKALGLTLPAKEQLAEVETWCEAVNQSLRSIGKQDCLIPANASGNCWSLEDAVRKKSGSRRIVIIDDVRHLRLNQLPVFGHFDRGPYSVPEISVAHKDYGDPYWLLQDIGSDGYYVLETRCKCFMYQTYDRTCNGSYYLEGDELVVENPTGETFYVNKSRHAKTVKDYYKKDQYGIYRKVGTAEGSWPAPERDFDESY